MLVLALGLTLNTKAGLGVSPIISIAFAVSEIWSLNFGDTTFLLYILFVAAQFLIRGKRSRLTDLLQLPLSLVFSRVLNLFSAAIPYQSAEHSFPVNFLLLLLAILLTGLGVSLTVNMKLVPNPGDGIVAAVAERMGRDQGFAKNIFDVGCVAFTCALGLLAAGRVVGSAWAPWPPWWAWAVPSPCSTIWERKKCSGRRACSSRKPLPARSHLWRNHYEPTVHHIPGRRLYHTEALRQPRRGDPGRPGPHR